MYEIVSKGDDEISHFSTVTQIYSGASRLSPWSIGIRILLATGGLALIVLGRRRCVGLALATAIVPWMAAWRGARGTDSAAVTWAGLALLIGLISQGVAGTESLHSGRPMAGHLVYLMVLASFAALISVLNARWPGGGAWAILMALLVLVFLIPWLEGPGWARKAQGLSRLRLDAPWSLFYVLVVIAGVTNYLPTRYGLSGGLARVRVGLRVFRRSREAI